MPPTRMSRSDSEAAAPVTNACAAITTRLMPRRAASAWIRAAAAASTQACERSAAPSSVMTASGSRYGTP